MRNSKIKQIEYFRRLSHTLLQLFFSALLLVLSSSLTLAADELSQELLNSRIQAIQQSGNSVEIATTLPIYEETLSWLRETEAQNQAQRAISGRWSPHRSVRLKFARTWTRWMKMQARSPAYPSGICPARA